MSKPDARIYKFPHRSLVGADYRGENKHDTSVFNVALVPDAAEPSHKVAVAGVDLVGSSEWFRVFMKNRLQMGDGNVDLLSLPLPITTTCTILEHIIASLYTGSIELGPDNLGEVLHAANAMQMPVIEAACKSYIADSLEPWDSSWAAQMHDMTSALNMPDTAELVARHMVKAALRSKDACAPLYRALAPLAGRDEQMRVLYAGMELSFRGPCWSHALLAMLLMRLDQLVEHPAVAARKRPRGGQHSNGCDSSTNDDSADVLDVAALLQLVDWGSLHAVELAALSQQAASCERGTSAAAVFRTAVLDQVARRAGFTGTFSCGTGKYVALRLDVDQLKTARALGSIAKLYVNGRLGGEEGAAAWSLKMERMDDAKWAFRLRPSGPGTPASTTAPCTICALYALGPAVDKGCVFATWDMEAKYSGGSGFYLPPSWVESEYVCGQDTQYLVLGLLFQPIRE